MFFPRATNRTLFIAALMTVGFLYLRKSGGLGGLLNFKGGSPVASKDASTTAL